jgi:alpha/beta superfamily hydrolase
VDGLARQLPSSGIGALRFDFSSSDLAVATAEVMEVVDAGLRERPELPVALVGYSFGAGIASLIDDERVVAWYLLAPQTAFLDQSPIGADPRPKAIAVPEHDQFSPPRDVEAAVSDWRGTTVRTIEGIDHFLGPVEGIVSAAAAWIGDAIAVEPG